MKIIVLDRDGVINQDSDNYIKNTDEWVFEAGSLEAIVKLKKAGWIVAVASNQSGIKRGFYSQQILSTMHLKMNNLLGVHKIDWINYSPYLPVDNSICRKPKSGLLRAIELRFGISLQGSYMIGDSLADINVAISFGMVPLLVTTGKGKKTLISLQDNNNLNNIKVFKNLLHAVESVL